jgi:hypothetical protein
MIVLDRDEAPTVDALLVDVPVEAEVVEAEIVEVVEAVLVDAQPLAASNTGALAQAVPQPVVREIAEPDVEARPNLRVAPDSYRRRRRVRIAAAAAAVSISITLFAVVGFNVVLAQHQIELQSLQKQLQVEQSRYYDLREEVARRASPQNIVSKATAQGLTVQQQTDLPAAVSLPAAGPTDTAKIQSKTSAATGGSRDHPVP